MSFFIVPQEDPRQHLDQVSVALRHVGRSKEAKVLIVSIGPRLAGIAHITRDDRIDVLFGAAEDFGKILIRRGGGTKVRTQKTQVLRAFWRRLPRGPVFDAQGERWRFKLDIAPARVMPTALTERGIEVTLPSDMFEADSRPAGRPRTAA